MPRPKDTTATLIPSFRCKDAPTAIEWLCRAFGFTKQLVVPGEGEPSRTPSWSSATA